jgi:hypothetical protein
VLAAEAMRELLAGPFKLEPAGTVDLNGFRAEEAWFLGRGWLAPQDAIERTFQTDAST